jgi:hypothetical protein
VSSLPRSETPVVPSDALVRFRLRAFVEAVGDNTSIILLGNHGEAFWEHQDRDRQFTDSRPNYCVGHGGTPFDVVARVPVGSSVPGHGYILPKNGWGSGCDLPATLVDLFHDGECQSLPGHAWTESVPAQRGVVCGGVRYGVERKAVYRSNRKLIKSKADEITLSARLKDGEEVFEAIPADDRRRLEGCFPDRWTDDDAGTGVDAVVEEQLESLGYT